ncbi:MAG: TIGR03435 family protein [Bryobacteraceae bacterium]|nr:TIGR03435 family protein [Bryobacteraceae bacterium]
MPLIIEASVRVVFVAAGVAAVVYGLRIGSARARHLAWCGVLLAMLLLPAFCAWGPKATLRVLPPSEAPALIASAATYVKPHEPSSMPSRSDQMDAAPAPVQAWPDLLWTAYLLIAAILLIRLIHGATRAASIPKRARRERGFFSSPECACPITVGWWRPVIVLPMTWTKWTKRELDAVLQHERSHVRRRDPLVQWLAALNRCIFWFHPLAWWLEHKLSVLAEETCDAAVIASGHDPRDYSEYLIHQARAVERAGARIAVSGAAIAGGILSHRIQRLIDGSPTPTVSRSRAILGSLLCIFVIATFTACQLGRAGTPATGQNAPKLEFEVASVKASADPARRSQDLRSGQLKFGTRMYGNRAEYNYMSLRQLIADAYQVRPFQVVCPDWLLTERFDIVAKMPAASRKEDAPLMLQSLLADRFKLAVHRESREEDVMALVVGKEGPNLVESPSATAEELPQETAPFTNRKRDGSSSTSFMMGEVSVRFTIDQATSSVHWEASRMAMADLAHLLMRADLGNGRPVVDRAGLRGSYEVALDIPMTLIGGMTSTEKGSISSAGGWEARPADVASDPGSRRMMRSLKSLGLELKKMKAPVERLVVDHVEKKPTEN